MAESLRELCRKRLMEYEREEFLEPDEIKNIDKILQECRDKIWNSVDFDERVALIKLENCYKQLAVEREKDAFIEGLLLGGTGMLLGDK